MINPNCLQDEPDLLSQPWSASMKALLEEAIQVGIIHQHQQNVKLS